MWESEQKVYGVTRAGVGPGRGIPKRKVLSHGCHLGLPRPAVGTGEGLEPPWVSCIGAVGIGAVGIWERLLLPWVG